jgi:CitMHS family citrate-Mg2+:H+ or citrate-Ca2+:H+ symporter
MLTLLGVGMILCFMYLIMSKRLSPIIALILIPFIFFSYCLGPWSLL